MTSVEHVAGLHVAAHSSHWRNSGRLIDLRAAGSSVTETGLHRGAVRFCMTSSPLEKRGQPWRGEVKDQQGNVVTGAQEGAEGVGELRDRDLVLLLS